MMTDVDVGTILARLDEIEGKKGGERAWDIAVKSLLPIVVALSAWLVGLEVRTSRLEDRVENSPPLWLKNDVQSIKATLIDIEQRLRSLERR